MRQTFNLIVSDEARVPAGITPYVVREQLIDNGQAIRSTAYNCYTQLATTITSPDPRQTVTVQNFFEHTALDRLPTAFKKFTAKDACKAPTGIPATVTIDVPDARP